MATPKANEIRPRRRRFGRRLAMILLAMIIAGSYWMLRGEKIVNRTGTTFTVKRGPMDITVLEGGSIEARESQEIKSEVQGQTKILSIIEEGYSVTPEDVEKGLVLVELDSKELLDQQTEQELQYQNAKAGFTEAQTEYEIQVNQNASDIKAAELDARFARKDFEKYLGEKVAGEIITTLGIELHESEPADAPLSPPEVKTIDAPNPAADNPSGAASGDTAAALPADANTESGPASGSESSPPNETPVPAAPPEGVIAVEVTHEPTVTVDFAQYADPERLGDGEARQKLRQLEDASVLAQEEVGLAETELAGTQRLFEREFVTKNDLENDELSFKRKQISRESADTSKDLFIKYEFPKQAEKLLSDYEEALRKLERAKKLAISKLAKAEANLNSAQARFQLQTRKRNEIREQIEKCVIRATKPGLVVYGSGDQPYWREERIEEGATVRERQVIITIPDPTNMDVKVKVHESFVKRVQKGQKVKVRVDAFPEEELTGEVQKIAVLPDSQNRWMNPDLKVYATTIYVDGTHDWLKPGLSAQAEIIVAQLPDVIQVPLQAVFPDNGQQVCYVAHLGEDERRVVETGDFNESFVEIKSGLKEGEVVLLRAPAQPEKKGGEGEGEEGAGKPATEERRSSRKGAES